MKTLSNDLKIFNATPHPITFQDGEDLIQIAPDDLIGATPTKEVVGKVGAADLITTVFIPNQEGWDVIARAKAEGADVIVGSIIAAQAYPGDVLGMVPEPGFERVPPAEKRMSVNEFNVFKK